MSSSNLKHKAVKGVFWTSIQRFMTIFIQFVSGIILARLLTPADYGCIGMLSIFMLIAASFVDGGFGSALIQKKQPNQNDYSTIFYWNLFISIVVYLILFFSAPAIADFYHTPILNSVLRVQGVVLIFNALAIVQVNILNKQFRFQKLSIITLTSSAISITVTIWMAYAGYGVWALVAQNILMALVPCILYWITSSWRPSLVFSVESFKSLFNFGSFMFLTSLINTIGVNIQGLLIGRFYNASIMGYYSKGYSTEKLASTSISQVIGQVSYPLYAEIQDDRKRMISALKKLTSSLFYITAPLMFTLILIAEPLFTLLYSDRWLPSVPYFQFLCLAGLALCLQSANAQTIAAIGKSNIMFKWAAIKQGIGLILVFLGIYFYGIWGLLVATVVKAYYIYFVNVSLVSKYIGYKTKKQLAALSPIFFLSVVCFVSSWLSTHFFDINIYVEGLIRMVVFLTLYISISIIFKLESARIVYDMLMPYYKKLTAKFKKQTA